MYAYVGNDPLGSVDPLGLMGFGGQRPWTSTGSVNKGDGYTVPRAPDFVNFQVDFYVFSIWGTFSRDGDSFVGGGFNKAYSNPLNLGANVSVGWLNTWSVTPGQTNKFISGYSGAGSVAYLGAGGGLVYSPDNGTATVIGFGAGYSYGPSGALTGGFSGGYTKDQGGTGISWDPAPSKCGCNK